MEFIIFHKKNTTLLHTIFLKSKNIAAKHTSSYTSGNDKQWGNMEIHKKSARFCIILLFTSIKNADETNLEAEKIEINNLISSTYLEMGDTTRANKYKLTALDLSKIKFRN